MWLQTLLFIYSERSYWNRDKGMRNAYPEPMTDYRCDMNEGM